jgi:hypothetical protein
VTFYPLLKGQLLMLTFTLEVSLKFLKVVPLWDPLLHVFLETNLLEFEKATDFGTKATFN